MQVPTGTVRRVVLLCVGALLVAACADHPPEVGRVPTETPAPATTSVTATPTPQTPKAEVEAAVRAYYAELTRAAQTNDTSTLRTMMTKGCPCYRAVRVINRNAKRGYVTPKADFKLANLRVHNLQEGIGLVEVTTDEAAYVVTDDKGGIVGRVDSRSSYLDLSLVQQDDGRWLIANEIDLGGTG